MKKIFSRIIVLTAVVMMTNGAGAQQLTEQQAKERAMRYLATHEKGIASRSKGLARVGNPSDKERLSSAKVEAKSIYAFNCEGGGSVIASADSRALPAGQPPGLQGRGQEIRGTGP